MALQGAEPDFAPQRVSFMRSLAIQARTMNALAVRFMVTRYGRENVGFLWVILEPMILCVGVMVIWSFLKGSIEHGVQIVAFAFSSYMPLTLQRHVSSSGVFMLRLSKAILLNHRYITHIDSLTSRMFMEFIGTSAACLVIYTILLAIGLIEPAYDLGTMLIGWLMMGCIATGFACIYAGASECSEVVEKFFQPVQYFLLPVSGTFFMVDWLPSNLHQYITYVPTVNAFEMFRAGLFGPNVTTHYFVLYGFSCGAIMIAVGLLLIEWVQDRVQA
ncbi:ABC transporter permease [Bosea psychrotolerans]|uniref:Capsular polysaccharide transport system permease protein n=1 Tax=Bosea psychrotolerans TaxID=1871628 RepID=A0A2S4MEY5_9HYPH|nr:ABC transporter permease [Bosea psychrotolerans]POR53306.1 capsular polysaccharide transport system permease protein [Bosea psychrotolerans]